MGGGAHHLLGGLHRSDHGVGDGNGDAGLLEALLVLLGLGVAGFGDVDLLGSYMDATFGG